MKIPQANTPWIMDKKKNTCKRIVIYSILISLIFFGLFLISINTDPPANFLVSILLLMSPFIVFFISVLYYYHVKLFPEFDFKDFDDEEISQLKISDKFIEKRNRLRRKKLIWFLILIIDVLVGIYPLTIGSRIPERPLLSVRSVMYAMDVLPAIGIVLCTKFLSKAVCERRHLEIFKYTLK